MVPMMAKNWWAMVLRGVLAIIFGILMILFPTIAIESFVLVFGAYAFVDGIFTVISAFQNRGRERWWLYLLEGVISILAGVLIFANPLFATMTLTLFALYIVAFWAIATGAMEIWAAIQMRKEIEGEFWLGLSGLLSIIFGIFLILSPGGGILALLTIVAVYAIIFGIFLIMLGLRLRGVNNQGTVA